MRNGSGKTSDEVLPPRVSVLLAPERVRIPLRAASKDGVLAELVDVVAASLDLTAERDAVLQAVREREGVLSTGIGGGVALPHAKYNGLNDLVMAAGVSQEPVEYGSLDGRPVRLFFLLLGPDSAAGRHVRALSRLSRIVQNESWRRRLVAVTDAQQFIRILGDAERVA